MKTTKKKRSPKVIGIMMTYNCANMIKSTYEGLPKGIFSKVIVADDGSIDKSVQVARKLGLSVYTHIHGGYGANIKFGLKKAVDLGADYAVEIHGDGQYDQSVVPTAIKKMETGYDFILGSRFINLKHAIEDGMPLVRYFANLGLSFIDRIVLGVNLTEFHTGFRVYSRRLIKSLRFEGTSDNYLYSFEIICQARFNNFRIGEIPMRCDYKTAHTSISIKKSIIYALGTFAILAKYILAKMGANIETFKHI